jgi:hypothetical protein
MSDRIGGTFPDERAARPPRSGAGAPGRSSDRRPSYGAGSRGGAPGRPADGGRPASGSGRSDSYRDRRDDRRGSDSELPRIPDAITDDQVSREVREELGSLSIDRAITVGRYLVAAELAPDVEQGYRYAQAAKRLAARVGIVREVSGVMAYKSGRWAEALTELQAGRRLTGRNDYLPLMADSERGLERLDRALDLVHSAEARRLPRAAQIELRIVESGIRRDQGLADAAVLALQVPELTDGKQRPWSARLFYAYGEALVAAGRPEAAREAFSRAVVADEDEETDALARLDELDGVTVADLEDDEDDDEEFEGDDLDDELDDAADEADLDDDEDEDDDEDGKLADLGDDADVADSADEHSDEDDDAEDSDDEADGPVGTADLSVDAQPSEATVDTESVPHPASEDEDDDDVLDPVEDDDLDDEEEEPDEAAAPGDADPFASPSAEAKPQE